MTEGTEFEKGDKLISMDKQYRQRGTKKLILCCAQMKKKPGFVQK
jgi:hypothetical protein